MNRNDYIGLGVSVLLHALLGLLLGYLTTDAREAPRLGYVEVEFGAFRSGRPVEAVDQAPEASSPETETPPPETPPEDVDEEPVTDPEPEPVEPPQEDPVSEETVPPTEEETVPPEPTEDPQPEEGADEQESDDNTGADAGDPGDGADEEKSAPYNIEGLNRDPLRAPLPEYTDPINATIRMRIVVGPDGRVTGVFPVQMGGSPELQEEVQTILRQWRFNALPAGAPQEVQRGIVTFNFTLE